MSNKISKNDNIRLKKREKKRTKIIEAAEKLFFNKGYENTKMQEIADDLKIAKGTLYIYFQSKQDLYLAILAKGLNIMNDGFNKAINKGKTGWEKLKLIGMSFLEFCNNNPGYADFLFKVESRISEEFFNKKVQSVKEYDDQNKRTQAIFMETMRLGFEDKSLRLDINPMKLGILLSLLSSAMIEHVIRATDFLKKQNIEPDEIITLLYELLGEALKPK